MCFHLSSFITEYVSQRMIIDTYRGIGITWGFYAGFPIICTALL